MEPSEPRLIRRASESTAREIFFALLILSCICLPGIFLVSNVIS